MKSKFFIAALASLLAIPTGISAVVEVSEVMYDVSSELGSDDKREWIELHNTGDVAIDVTGWKINDGSNHALNEPPLNGGRGVLTVPPQGYVVLADDATVFLEAFTVPPTTTVIDTVLSLNNSGDTITLYDANGGVVDSATYTADVGASGDGRTLHRINKQAFLHGSATPGTVQPDDVGVVSEVESEPVSASHKASAIQEDVTPKFKLRLNGPKDVIVGATAFFEGEVIDSKGDPIAGSTRIVWNFGDSLVAEGSAVEHTWKHPGRYALVVTVSSGKTALTEQRIIAARPAHIELTFKDQALELRNASSRDLDVSHWLVQTEKLFFVIPEHTIILAGELIRFTSDVVRMPLSLDTVVAFPNGVIVATATPILISERFEKMPEKNTATEDFVLAQTEFASEENNAEEISREREVNDESKVAPASTVEVQSAASAAALVENVQFSFPTAPWILSLLGIIGIGIVGVSAARSIQKEVSPPGWLIEEID